MVDLEIIEEELIVNISNTLFKIGLYTVLSKLAAFKIFRGIGMVFLNLGHVIISHYGKKNNAHVFGNPFIKLSD